MRKYADILKVIGGIILVYSAVITFKTKLPQDIENIIYFRGVLFGSILLLVGSAITTKNFACQNILYSLATANFLVFVASIHNLLYDSIVNLDFYFNTAIYGAGLSFIIITSARHINILRTKLFRLWRRLFKSSI